VNVDRVVFLVILLANKQANKQTNSDENTTSTAEAIKARIYQLTPTARDRKKKTDIRRDCGNLQEQQQAELIT